MEDMDGIDLGQGKNRCRALVNVVMKLRFPKMQGISWLAAEFLRGTFLHADN
jgi:hypothetical protein